MKDESTKVAVLEAQLADCQHALTQAHGVAQACELRALEAEAERDRLRAAIESVAERLEMNLADASRPDHWSIESMVFRLREALAEVKSNVS